MRFRWFHWIMQRFFKKYWYDGKWLSGQDFCEKFGFGLHEVSRINGFKVKK